MIYLIIGVVLFLGVHLFPRAHRPRARLVRRVGERSYRAGFSLLALAGLVLVVIGMIRADFTPLYVPLAWAGTLSLVLMPVSIMLLAAANMPTNIKRFTRHPMLWGVVLWSVTHLLANGDLASVLLFGSFGIYALADMALTNAQGLALSHRRYAWRNDLRVVAAGGTGFVILFFLHGYLFGASLI